MDLGQTVRVCVSVQVNLTVHRKFLHPTRLQHHLLTNSQQLLHGLSDVFLLSVECVFYLQCVQTFVQTGDCDQQRPSLPKVLHDEAPCTTQVHTQTINTRADRQTDAINICISPLYVCHRRTSEVPPEPALVQSVTCLTARQQQPHNISQSCCVHTLLWTLRCLQCVCSPGLFRRFHEELKHVVHDENISAVKKSLLQTHISVQHLQKMKLVTNPPPECARVMSGYCVYSVCIVGTLILSVS